LKACEGWRSRYFIELLAPKQDAVNLEQDLETFARKYRTILAEGHIVSLTDNPMGHLSFQATELIAELGLPVVPDQVLVHLNTCHTREGLDEVLTRARELGIRCLLVVTGDGSPRLPKLTPESLGVATNSVTSVELLGHIQRAYPDGFHCGVAFNPYEPPEHELEKLERKLGAGAQFVITQPLLRPEERVLALRRYGVPVILGAWMSRKLHLLSECVGYPIPEDTPYDPLATLRALRESCGECGLYLSVVNLEKQLPQIRELLK